MPRILAIIIAYFPDKPVEEIIKNFEHEVDTVMVVDNTNNNIGVAAALNQGLKRAIDEGYDWLLTMDQDSVFEEGALKELKNVSFTCKENVALLSPFHFIKKTPKSTAVQEVTITMTSGNLLRVSAAKTIGPFEEKLFIDSVDNEYCLRLSKFGFKVIRVNQSILHHRLGTLKENSLGFSTTTYSATRRYYITRNMLYVMSKYFPQFFLFGSKELIKSFLLILLVEDDKTQKFKSMLKGIGDWTKISK